MGLLKALLDALQGSDEQIGGQAVTKLTALLTETELVTMSVESTIGFGENTDGTSNAKLLVGGEVITATGRTGAAPFTFTTLARGVASSTAKQHPAGTLVYDISRNASALEHVRRGFMTAFALGEDLDVIGRNLGMHRCPGLGDDEYRRIVEGVAYLPKQPIDAFKQAMIALLNSPTAFTIVERIIHDPWTVFVEIDVPLATSLRGRFVLNGGEPALTTGANTVDTDYAINHVIGVYDDTPATRAGYRGNPAGLTNYFGAGSFLGNTVTMAASPGGAATPVIVDYGAFKAHYLPLNETIRDDADLWPYLADPLAAARCVLDQVRAAGIKVELSVKV